MGTPEAHLDGVSDNTNRLKFAYGAADDRAFCSNCHAAASFNNSTSGDIHNTVDGTVCQTCHAPRNNFV